MSEVHDIESVYRIGDLYWRRDTNESKDWILVKLSALNATSLTGTCVLIDERTGSRMPNQTESVDLNNTLLCPANPLFVTYADMTSLRYLHEAALVKNLYDRWIATDRQPYTSMSNVLIAVNPLRYLKKLEKLTFVTQSLDKSPPHPYNVAENAYRQLRTVKQNQSIIISGESGSGKTETSKIILDFLTERSSFTGGHPAFLSKSNQDDVVRDQEHALGERLMETIPILESFGNAKTHRNHNSSRFGKYMRLQFSPDEDIKSTALHLTGASIDTYLLETSRVVHPPEGERNFHVFYELLRSGDPKLLQELKLVPNPYIKSSASTSDIDAWLDQYHYLNRSGCTQSNFIDDRQNFQNLKEALTFAGISPSELFRIVAGILHLGNLSFDEEDTPEGMTATIHREDASEASIDIIAQLLGIKTDDLIDALLKKKIERTKGSFQRRGSVYFVGKTIQQALYSRDTVAKMIYDQVFSSLMHQCADILEYNSAMKDELPYIGVLDIFGFEDFEPKNRNSFEQLLINYANEALQSMFNQCILKAEQELYQAENIWAPQNASLLFPFDSNLSLDSMTQVNRNESTKPISYDDNRECLSLIADRRDGILAILNTVGRLAGPSDRKLNERFHSTFKKHSCFILPHPRDAQHTFCIKHYAGVVRYRIDGFIDKNNNVASAQFKELIGDSSLKLLNASSYYATSKTPNGSVSEMFSHQMKGLVLELDSTRNNFIRCIKPYPAMDVKLFDRQSVLDQLRCSGTIQACQVLQVGLPTRVSYEELVFIYSEILGIQFMNRFHEKDRLFTQALCKVLDFPTDAFRLGDTRLFFKTGKIHLLDTVLAVTPAYPPAELKSRLVTYMAKYRWISATTKVVILRACEEMFLNCRQGRRAIVLQCWFRQILARKRVQKLKSEKRVAGQWSHFLKKIQVRAAFDQSVEDKLALLNALLRNTNLNSNGRWLLTWLGPLQRAMYVRKLGRSACVAYLAKRAFVNLLDTVRQRHACVKIQSQFRRILATKKVNKLRQQHKAQVRWNIIRLVTKVNICFMNMYRRAHVFGLERNVDQLFNDNERLLQENQSLLTTCQSIEKLENDWKVKEKEFQATILTLSNENLEYQGKMSMKEDEITTHASRIEQLEEALEETNDVAMAHERTISKYDAQVQELTNKAKLLEAQAEAMEKMYTQSKEQNATLIADSQSQLEKFAEQADSLQSKMNDSKHQVRLKSMEVAELEEYNAELKEENETLTSQLEDLEQAHERELATQMQQNARIVAELASQLESLQDKYDRQCVRAEKATMELNEHETKSILHCNEIIELNQLLEQTRSESTQRQVVFDAELAAIKETNGELALEIETFQNDIIKANETIEQKSNKIMELEVIKEQYKEKGTALMDKMVQLEKALAASKEEELKLALAAQQQEHDTQVVSLQSQLKTLQLQLKKSEAEIHIQNSAAKEFEMFKGELRADNNLLKEKVAALSSTLAESKEKELTLDMKLSNANDEINMLSSQVHAGKLKQEELRVHLKNANETLAMKATMIEELENVREELTQVHGMLTREMNTMKRSQIAAKQVEDELDSQLADSTERVVALGAQLRQMQLKLDQVNDHMTVTDAVVMAEEAMKNQLLMEKDALADKVDSTTKAIAQGRDKELELVSQVSQYNRDMSSLVMKLENTQASLDEANSRIGFQSIQLSDSEAKIQELKETIETIQENSIALESKLYESTANERAMEEKLDMATLNLSNVTKQLQVVHEEISHGSKDIDVKLSAMEEFDTIHNEMKTSNNALSEKVTELASILATSNEKEYSLEEEIIEKNKKILKLKLKNKELKKELNEFEIQLEATISNALELKNLNEYQNHEIIQLKNNINNLKEENKNYFQMEINNNIKYDEKIKEMNIQIKQYKNELDQIKNQLISNTAILLATETINKKLNQELKIQFDELEKRQNIINKLKLNEQQLGIRIATNDDHIYALETQLTQFLSKYDYESDHFDHVKVVPSSELMPLKNIKNTQVELTKTSIVPNVPAVYIPVASEEINVKQDREDDLAARIDGNNNRMATLEAHFKLLEMKQEHMLQENNSNACIEKLKANLIEKENLIQRLQEEIHTYENASHITTTKTISMDSSIVSNDSTKNTVNAVAQLEEQVIQQQDLMRRIRKVVLQSRWKNKQSHQDEPEPEIFITRAFTTFESISFDDEDGL